MVQFRKPPIDFFTEVGKPSLGSFTECADRLVKLGAAGAEIRHEDALFLDSTFERCNPFFKARHVSPPQIGSYWARFYIVPFSMRRAGAICRSNR